MLSLCFGENHYLNRWLAGRRREERRLLVCAIDSAEHHPRHKAHERNNCAEDKAGRSLLGTARIHPHMESRERTFKSLGIRPQA